MAPTVEVRPVEWEKIVSETPKQDDLKAAGRTYSVTELARELGSRAEPRLPTTKE